MICARIKFRPNGDQAVLMKDLEVELDGFDDINSNGRVITMHTYGMVLTSYNRDAIIRYQGLAPKDRIRYAPNHMDYVAERLFAMNSRLFSEGMLTKDWVTFCEQVRERGLSLIFDGKEDPIVFHLDRNQVQIEYNFGA